MKHIILYVHNSADIYGASRSLLRLVSVLDRQKFVPLVLLPSDGPLREKIEEQNVKVIVDSRVSVITRAAFKPPRIITFLAKLPFSILSISRLIKKEQVSLVHTNTGVIVSTAASARLAGVPHVWHVRDWFGEFAGLWPLYSKYILSNSCNVICPSAATASQFPPSPKLKIIHNGFDLSEFSRPPAPQIINFKKEHNLENSFIIGCVGRIKLVRKGQDTLVKAAALLKERHPNFTYIIVGSPFEDNVSHLDALKKLINDLGVQSIMRFIGELTDPKPAYAAMDISVIPSAAPEPFGGVVLESMCMGVPVIGTNLGGTPEMIEHEKSGMLFEPGNPKQLAAIIEELYKSAEKRENLAKAARTRVEKYFSITKTSAQIQNIYENCLSPILGPKAAAK